VEEISDELFSLWDHSASLCESMGAKIDTLSIPSIKHCLPLYYIIAPAEASSNLARYDGVRYGEKKKKNCKNFFFSLSSEIIIIKKQGTELKIPGIFQLKSSMKKLDRRVLGKK
jgi:Asp-tRNA(Asn)/Glu-tRNA(Gln) amidotransferase A subunit family amidase